MDASRLERAAKALREIELSALAHHEHEGKMTLLHALQVEIPKMAEDARAAIAAHAQAAPQGDGRSGQDRASDKWRGAEEIAARDYWHAHANGQPISESWLDGWLSRAKQHRAAPSADAERAFIEAAMDLGKCLSAKGARGADAHVVVFQNKYRALLAHRQGRPACDERS